MQAILFDLDGTLLDIDIGSFIQRYFGALSDVLRDVADDGDHHARALHALHEATMAMMHPHSAETNRAVFDREFLRLTGIDLLEHESHFDHFYTEVFPTLKAELGPIPGALDAFKAAEECNLRIAIATNPIFPLSAIKHRLSWTGIDPDRANIITSYENMHTCKPQPGYFHETAKMLGVPPHACLMVGDDRMLDLPAADIGMQTFYIGGDSEAASTYQGTMSELADLLPRLCME